MKGDLEQAHDLAPYFDWNLTEECYQYQECTKVYNPADGKEYPGLQSFTRLNKAVWVAEYKTFATNRWANICTNSAAQHFNTARYRLGLPNNGGRQSCPTASSAAW